MPLHGDQIQLSRIVGANFREAKEYGLLTDASVAADNTVVLLRADLVDTSLHGDSIPPQPRFDRAVDFGVATAEITDALLAPLTTVDGLIGLTQGGSDVMRDIAIQ